MAIRGVLHVHLIKKTYTKCLDRFICIACIFDELVIIIASVNWISALDNGGQ